MPPQNQRRFVGIQTLELPGFAQPQTHRSLEPRACLYECPYLASASLCQSSLGKTKSEGKGQPQIFSEAGSNFPDVANWVKPQPSIY